MDRVATSDPSGTVLVQQDSYYTGNVATETLKFGESVTSGDVVVVGIAIFGATVTSVTDSLSPASTYTLAASVCKNDVCTYVYYASLGSGGSDTITVSDNFYTEGVSIYIYEVSGASVAGVVSATGGGVAGATPPSTIQTSSSASFNSGAFLLGMIGANEYVDATASSGFTLSPQSEQGSVEYCSDCAVTSPTNFPATTSDTTSLQWEEVGIALEPSASLSGTSTTVSCNSNPVDEAVPTTCTAIVSTTGLNAPTGTVTFTSTDDNGVFSASPGSTFTAPSACTLSTIFGEQACAVTFTPGAGSEGGQTVTANYGGDTSNAPSSNIVTLTVDQRTTSTEISCPSSFEGGTTAVCTVTVTDTDTGTPSVPTGTVMVTDTLEVFGSTGTSCTLAMESSSTSSCSVSYDPLPRTSGSDSITASYPGDTDHASSGGHTSIDVTAAPPTEVQVSITLNQYIFSGGLPSGSTLSASNYFTVSYTAGGSPQTAEEPGGTISFLADQDSTVTISAESSGSPTVYGDQMWCLAASYSEFSDGAPGTNFLTAPECTPTSFPISTSSVSVIYTYFDLVDQFFTYQIFCNLCNGGNPAPPTLTYSLIPSSAGEALMTTTTTLSLWYLSVLGNQPGCGSDAGTCLSFGAYYIWVIAGSNILPNELTISGANTYERWQEAPQCYFIETSSYNCPTPSGVAESGGEFWFFDYYAQTDEFTTFTPPTGIAGVGSPSVTYTSLGAQYQATLTTGTTPIWMDDNTAWTADAQIGPATSERYECITSCSGTVPTIASVTLASLIIDPIYTEQFLVNFGIEAYWQPYDGLGCGTIANVKGVSCYGSLANGVVASDNYFGSVWVDAGPLTLDAYGYDIFGWTSCIDSGGSPNFYQADCPSSGISIPYTSTGNSFSIISTNQGSEYTTQITIDGPGNVYLDLAYIGGGNVFDYDCSYTVIGPPQALEGCVYTGGNGVVLETDPAYLLVTAPDNQGQVGCDAMGNLVDTLVGASVSSCSSLTELITLTGAPTGTYTFQLFPITGESDSYRLTITNFISGSPSAPEVLSGTLGPSGTSFYEMISSGGTVGVGVPEFPPGPLLGLALPLLFTITVIPFIRRRRN